ncbi:hypothetical protein J2W91_004699 [Paenibacillus amylolyticus]|uniref:Uncharacterized protein n=1 Tax=Paenibacillus amylolyticus TaxID=1451 RepID=A0AAP5H7I6_PAEAM|nr:hypothetical protein [Paenibacillus amylolyticus]
MISKIEYQNKFYSVNDIDSFDQSTTIMASPGDTRTTHRVFIWSTYIIGNEQADLARVGGEIINIGAGMTHPYVGAFLSILDLFLVKTEYVSYKSTITRKSHDYEIK